MTRRLLKLQFSVHLSEHVYIAYHIAKRHSHYFMISARGEYMPMSLMYHDERVRNQPRLEPLWLWAKVPPLQGVGPFRPALLSVWNIPFSCGGLVMTNVFHETTRPSPDLSAIDTLERKRAATMQPRGHARNLRRSGVRRNTYTCVR